MNQRFNISCLFFAMFMEILSSRLAMGETVTINAGKDNTLYETASGYLSNGNGQNFVVGVTAQGMIRRGVIFFEVDQHIQPGVIIKNAELKLHMSQSSIGIADISLHKVTSAWDEGGSDAGSNAEAGIAAMNSDATWIHSNFPDEFWITPGGDYSKKISSSTAVESAGFYIWRTSENLVADVQAWLNAPDLNYGWILTGQDMTRSIKCFDSLESFNLSFVPVLTVEYSMNSGFFPFELDADGDGFTISQGDCNNADAAIFPGAIEIIDDGIDQDCNNADETALDIFDSRFADRVHLTLVWDASEGATSYEVYRSEEMISQGGMPVKINSTSETTISDFSIIPDKTYYYWVRARNEYGFSRFSNYIAGSVKLKPSAPTALTASYLTFNDRIRLTWNASSKATSYDVYRLDKPVPKGGILLKIKTTKATITTDFSAAPGVIYYYRVKAINDKGISEFSVFATGLRGQ